MKANEREQETKARAIKESEWTRARNESERKKQIGRTKKKSEREQRARKESKKWKRERETKRENQEERVRDESEKRDQERETKKQNQEERARNESKKWKRERDTKRENQEERARNESEKRTAQLKDVIKDMVNDDDLSVACQHCHIHLKATGTFDKSETPAGPQIRLLSEGPAANCARDQVALVEDKHMYVPIVSKQQTLGVLEFVAESFSPEDQRTARIMARHVAIFMERLADSD